jgi:hypothetical protein
MINRRCFLTFLLITIILNGCAAAPIPVTTPMMPGAVIETLTSSVALSVKAGDNGLSGRGYLVMSSPDRFRLVILSPFGTTLAEMFLLGDQLLYIDSPRNLAYQGGVSELPDIPALQGWRLLRWTAEPVFPETAGQRQLVRKRAGGEWEFVHFDRQGLVTNKSVDGDIVRYENYQSVSGVPVPAAIEITDRAGVTLRITFDEPEVNAVLDKDSFVPSLEGVKVLPLSQFPAS